MGRPSGRRRRAHGTGGDACLHLSLDVGVDVGLEDLLRVIARVRCLAGTARCRRHLSHASWLGAADQLARGMQSIGSSCVLPSHDQCSRVGAAVDDLKGYVRGYVAEFGVPAGQSSIESLSQLSICHAAHVIGRRCRRSPRLAAKERQQFRLFVGALGRVEGGAEDTAAAHGIPEAVGRVEDRLDLLRLSSRRAWAARCDATQRGPHQSQSRCLIRTRYRRALDSVCSAGAALVAFPQLDDLPAGQRRVPESGGGVFGTRRDERPAHAPSPWPRKRTAAPAAGARTWNGARATSSRASCT
jgi:hypothetical protein